eukprot:4720181-Pleurochrysis_carterae.AAC.5
MDQRIPNARFAKDVHARLAPADWRQSLLAATSAQRKRFGALSRAADGLGPRGAHAHDRTHEPARVGGGQRCEELNRRCTHAAHGFTRARRRSLVCSTREAVATAARRVRASEDELCERAVLAEGGGGGGERECRFQRKPSGGVGRWTEAGVAETLFAEPRRGEQRVDRLVLKPAEEGGTQNTLARACVRCHVVVCACVHSCVSGGLWKVEGVEARNAHSGIGRGGSCAG